MKNLKQRIFNKGSKVASKIYAFVNPAFAKKYYSKKYAEEIQNIGDQVVFSGKVFLDDPREIVIGKNTKFGSGCKFFNKGGVYIGDDCVICDNVEFQTELPTGLSSDNFGKRVVQPIIIEPQVKIEDNVKIHPGVKIPSGTILKKGTTVDLTTQFSPRTQIASGKEGTTVNATSFGSNMFFLSSTGRSGTNALAKILSGHSKITCIHEQHYLLNRLSNEYAHGVKEASKVAEELKAIFINASTIDRNALVYGESDLKNSNLISLYYQLLPEAKHIWLIRRADSFVASAYGRGWFDNREYSCDEIYSADKIANDNIFDFYRLEYSQYRLNGGNTKQISDEEWKKMSSFERNCWYWSYWNTMIERQLKAVPKEQWIMIKLENLKEDLDKVSRFLNVPNEELRIETYNEAYHSKHPRKDWSDDQLRIYQKWCGEGMKKWYNDK